MAAGARFFSLVCVIVLTLPASLAWGQACPDGPNVMDFDTDSAGVPILAGQDVSSAYTGFGVDIIVWPTMAMNYLGVPTAFGSDAPTGGDWDLGTPNQDFGGPGIGAGGESGAPGQNDTALGNLLISAENTVDADGDGLIDDPDDEADGAWFEFFFDEPTCVFGFTLIDNEASEGTADVLHYNESGNVILWVDAAGLGNNSVEVVQYEICGVDHMMLDLYGSGAFDNVQFCVGGEPEVCDGIDNDGDGDIDEGFADTDGDGSADCVDCADNDPNVSVASDEICDGIDNDCDGIIDEPLFDATSAVNDPAVRPQPASHSITLPGISTEFSFDPPGIWTQDESAGTATLTGTVWNDLNPTEGFEVDIVMSGWTDGMPAGSPHIGLLSSAYVWNGGPVDPDTFIYYTSWSGTLSGVGDFDGATIELTQRGPSWQTGYGANNKNLNFGASAWLNYVVTSQPNSGPALQSSGIGDVNIDHATICGDEVCDGADNDGDGVVDEPLFDATLAPNDAYGQYAGNHAMVLGGVLYTFDPPGVFHEDEDAGTATLTGHLVKNSDPSAGFDVSVSFSGSTDVAPAGSPKLELISAAYVWNGGPVDPDTWHYYPVWGGTLTGTGSHAGAVVDITRTGPSYQVGFGANGKNAGFGSSGWIAGTVISQPSSGPSISTSGTSDFNLDHESICAEEICDGFDNDYDGDIDEGFDLDNDGWTTCAGDCDDGDPNVNPDCPDVCNGVDDDCDGAIDEDFDNDNDGWTSCGGDCDDNNPNANPDCPDICNGIDDDCDGDIDEDFDQDGDGVTSCGGDCDDDDATVYPGAPEVCDGQDNDCDGALSPDEIDDDGDGQSECDGDCDDAPETCNGIDDDCDGDIDEGFDADGDGVTSCDGDCDDSNPEAYPGAPEACDNVDTDCDGELDNGFDEDGDGIVDCVDECPMTVDFDVDPWGDSLDPWIDASDSYWNWGITIEEYDDPSLEDSSPAVTADIGVPALGNVMPADDDANTWWIVNFSSSTCVHSIDLVGVAPDELAAQVILFDVNVQTIATYEAAGLGDTSLETVDLGGTCGVYVMLIDFYDSGAWDNLVVCVDPDGTEEVCFDGEDNDGDGEVDEGCEEGGPEGDDDDDDDGDDDDDDDEDSDSDSDSDSDGGEEGDPDCSMAGERSPSGALAFLLFALLGLTSAARRGRTR